VWVVKAHDDEAHWNESRIAIMFLYFPVVLTGLELVPLALNLVPSYACFLLVRSESSGKPKT